MCEAITTINRQLMKNNSDGKNGESNLDLLPPVKHDRPPLNPNIVFTKSDHDFHFPGLPLPPENHNYFSASPQNVNANVNNSSYNNLKQENGLLNSEDLPFAFNTSERNGSNEEIQKYRPFVCKECGKSYTQKCHLTAHSRLHTGIKPHTCFQCGKSFTQKHSLNTHMLLHQSDRPHTCTKCKKSFTLKHHLVAHEKVHSREKPFECTECGQTFPLKRHLVTHQKFHAGERPYICKDCGESFAVEEHLQNHSRFHGSLNSFRCNNCGETFTRKFELMNHSRMYGHGYFPLICQICGKEFLQKKTLISHMGRFHANVEFNPHFQTKAPSSANQQVTELVCTRCPAKFNSREALLIHEKFHDGDTSIFNDLLVLSQHQNLQMPFNSTATTYTPPAKIQNTNAGQNGNLNHFVNGILSNYSLDKHKPYVCNFCSKPFSTKHGLFHHNKRHPEGTCTEKPFSCQTCGKSFSQTNYLLLHERVHMDRKSGNNSAKQLNNAVLRTESISTQTENNEQPFEGPSHQGGPTE